VLKYKSSHPIPKKQIATDGKPKSPIIEGGFEIEKTGY
jgi:hypothetical protein